MVDSLPPLVVVDAANVVGSIPNGWWRDRAGATERLRDALDPVAAAGLTGPGIPAWAGKPPLEVVLVVEGQASRVRGTVSVRVIAARGEGDDAIVNLVGEEAPQERDCLVITADRELRNRIRATRHGAADFAGPRCVYP